MTVPQPATGLGIELDVLGVRVHLVDEAEALARIQWMHDHNPPRYVSYVNPHTVNIAFGDPAFRSALSGAGLRLPDGFGLRIAARRQGVRVPAILNGSDFNEAVLRHAAARGWGVFLLGGRPGVADLAAERLQHLIPNLRLTGTHHGYFADNEADAVLDRVRTSGGSVLMLALGQPRQERWLERHLPETGARVGLAVGGFLDFAAGTVRRAPAWIEPRRPRVDLPAHPRAAEAGAPVPRRQPRLPVAGVPRERRHDRPQARGRIRDCPVLFVGG
jgi:exopolysaccharide biosynthesis WecB/TagA/CpsF family protein